MKQFLQKKPLNIQAIDNNTTPKSITTDEEIEGSQIIKAIFKRIIFNESEINIIIFWYFIL
jgi:hypothetical protein